MKLTITTIFCLLFFTAAKSQDANIKWYSEHSINGVTIQNSLPKGGRYPGPTIKHFNYSYLVFYHRVLNESEHPIELNIDFSADSISIQNSPNTYMKVFLPKDTMSVDKVDLLSYGVTQVASLEEPTNVCRIIKAKEDYFFYTVAVFYQTRNNVLGEDRGGNRAEFIFNGKDLIFNMLPQIDALPCGRIYMIR